MKRLADLLHPILTSLVAARQRAGLSQRALSDKVGLAQSHISKIERAAVDPQISSLLEIARILGLEVMLVPRQLVPALQALEREVTPDPRRLPSAVDHELTLLARHGRQLAKRFPELHALLDLSLAADELRLARPDELSYAAVRASLDAARACLKDLSRTRSNNASLEATRNAAARFESITQTLRSARNAWTHRDLDAPSSQAYRLDDADA